MSINGGVGDDERCEWKWRATGARTYLSLENPENRASREHIGYSKDIEEW